MKVLIVGGGAAGMMAGYISAINGHETVIIEKNSKLGKKLFITGKGRCNLTNACDMSDFFSNIVSNEKFMYSSLYGFDNQATIELFNNLGLRTKVERGNRVFPESDKSSDVIKTLEKTLRSNGVKIILDNEVVDIIIENNQLKAKPKDADYIIKGVILSDGDKMNADCVIFATGGKSYQLTGSDGKAFNILSKYGIEVSELKPALVPFNVLEDYVYELSGLSLKNVTLTVYVDNIKIYSGFGEMLFTHFGISGPLVISASSYLNKKYYGHKASAVIDLKPALSSDVLDDRIVRDFAANKNKIIKNVLPLLLPSSIISSVLKIAGIKEDKPINIITKAEREGLVRAIKNYPLTIVSTRGFDEAIITSGGIKVKEINPSTMESKKIKNLYFAGEMVDVDALTGGFNLQLAWSMGHLAGELGGYNE